MKTFASVNFSCAILHFTVTFYTSATFLKSFKHQNHFINMPNEYLFQLSSKFEV